METGRSPGNMADASKPSKYAWQHPFGPSMTDVQVCCRAEAISCFVPIPPAVSFALYPWGARRISTYMSLCSLRPVGLHSYLTRPCAWSACCHTQRKITFMPPVNLRFLIAALP
jgi:hypothetical protein